jgi:hypothetical protein
MRMKIGIVILLAALLAAPAARGQSTSPPPEAPAPGEAEKPASKAEVRALLEELRRLKLELGLRDVAYQSYAGMGPAASKVYFAPRGLSIGGYGEFNYVNVPADASANRSDLLRLVLYAGYRFGERIVFNSEIEFEHAGKEIGVEFAYLDFLLSKAVRLRAGSVLVPIGFVNEMHEPAFFNGVFRPDVERRIIPTTWNENGIGLHGEVAGLRYKAYLLTGLDLFRETDEPVEAGSWVREARSGGGESRAATLAGVLNLDYVAGPATVGGTIYRGRADQRQHTAAGEAIRADVTLAEAHAQLSWRGAQARVLGVVGTLGDAAEVNATLGLPPDEGLGSRVTGGYVEVAYDVLALLAAGGESTLSPFVRVERYDLNARVPAGAVRDPALDTTVVAAGLTYKPIPTVVVKADWQRTDTAASGSASDRVSFGAGFVF